MTEVHKNAPKPFTPKDMARIAMRNRPPVVHATKPEAADAIPLPHEGGLYEKNGCMYRFVKYDTGKTVWNRDTQQREPLYFTLRTYFSHSTDEAGPGPGWDSRLSLPKLSPSEMMQRYGHIFTHDEIFQPRGTYDYETDTYNGGMPDDIPYFDIVRVDDDVEQ